MTAASSGAIALTLLLAGAALPARAQEARVEALERKLAEQQARIDRLEALVNEQNALLTRVGAPAPTPAPPANLVAAAAPIPAPAAPGSFGIDGLDMSGDLRVREEFNFSDADARDRSRTVLRARLRATYRVADGVALGAQLATGDPDDPNSTDITLTGFDDDLDVSLDQVWVRYQSGGLTLHAGKFPQILQRTDMVWDGDVVPEGVGGSYAVRLGAAQLDARAIYFIVDEASGGPDSRMLGGQAVLTVPLAAQVRLTAAGGYYDYVLHALAGADAGDFRSNLLANGRYVSDYRLVDGIATLAFTGLGERWPITLTADYVHNLGAAVPAADGFNVELGAGRTARRGDWRILYNYSEVGVDAVFAAFSHDNLALATNYRLHGLSIDYVPVEHVLLDATWYHYRPLDPLYAGANQPLDWLNRVRLNLVLSF